MNNTEASGCRYVDVDAALRERGLSCSELNSLLPDGELHGILLAQPSGIVVGGKDFIGAKDRGVAHAKLLHFLELASGLESRVHLAVTAEYSCPLPALKQAIAAGHLPLHDALWILGCEGSTVADLRGLQRDLPDVEWLCDPVPELGPSALVDPLCYLFWAYRIGDPTSRRLTALIQYKTRSMADKKLHDERNILSCGETVYVFNLGREDRIRLVTLVCSDSLRFTRGSVLPGSPVLPLVIVHIQLCADPRHAEFKMYRWLDFHNWRENREFLTVNWARGFVVEHATCSTTSEYGGSALYMQSRELCPSEAELNGNHATGLYYVRHPKTRTHIFAFHYDEHVFWLRTTKTSQSLEPGARQQRTGPRELVSYEWSPQLRWQKTTPPVDDGFHGLCTEVNQVLSPLNSPDLPPTDRERLLALSTAQVSGRQGEISNVLDLPAFLVSEDEVIRRSTVCIDPADDAVAYRRHQILLFCELRNTILRDRAALPPQFGRASDDWSISYPIPETARECNLLSTSGATATGAYIGIQVRAAAERACDRLAAAVSENRRSGVIVWYRGPGPEVSSLQFSTSPSIVAETGEKNMISTGDQT